MEIKLTEKDLLKLERLTKQYNFGLTAMNTSVRWTTEDLALRILHNAINSQVDFLPDSNSHESYSK